jgi:hypothetical protein
MVYEKLTMVQTFEDFYMGFKVKGLPLAVSVFRSFVTQLC